MPDEAREPPPAAEQKDAEQAEQRQRGHSIREWGKSLMVTLIAVLLIKAFLLEAYVVRGASMEPTLNDGERLLLEKVTKRFGSLQRGDIVVFRYPEDTKKLFIKRIIALPGDTIRIYRKRVWINGVELEEKYVPDEFRAADFVPKTTIPVGRYFVMGDHRCDSLDSRRWGTVESDKIIGKALVRFWPLTRIHPL